MNNKGIIMCNYKNIRKELGTVNYLQNETSLKNEKMNYIEIYKNKKKEKIKSNKPAKKTIKKTITIQNDSKSALEKEIEKTKEPEIITDSNEVEEILQEKLIEDIDQLEETKKNKKEVNQENEEEVEEVEKVEEVEEEEILEGGSINPFKKRIYLTDLSVDKDKEMFQI
jgi:hypothetical protein